MFVLNALDQQAERTDVIVRRMVVQFNLYDV
jgi:hypothetical protein